MSVSSDLIPVSSSSEVSAIAVKPGKKELVSADVVASWLDVTSSGKELLSSVIPSTAQNFKGAQIKAETNFAVIAINTGMFGLLSSIIGGFVGAGLNYSSLAGHGPLNSVTYFSPPAIAVVAGAASFYFPMRSVHRNSKKLWSQLMSVQSDGTRKWLQERYGVGVSDEVLMVLASDVLTDQDSTPFADEKGQLWVLRRSSSGLYQVEPQQVAVEASEVPDGIRQAPVVLSVGAAHLDGELGELGEKIDTRLAQLQKFALTVEESHVVSRTVGDARDAVAAFEWLQLLGAEESGTAYLLDVLRLLDSELEGIVQVKVSQETELLRSSQQKAIARQSEVGV
jgi:hypothetical protein